MAEQDPFIALSAITKRYAGVTALDGVDFTVNPGEAVCIAGENGSGKSTLIKIISGVENATEGTIRIGGETITRNAPRIAADKGVMVIFQDFSLFPNMSVAENIALTTQMSTGRRFFDHRGARETARDVLARIGVEIDPSLRVEQLPVAQKQLVAIARALASDARLIIMDEPTTALTEKEVTRLLGIIRKLKEDGVAVIFVSHKLAEVLEVSEKVVVLRNGRKVAEGPASDFDTASLTYHMTGRDVPEETPAPLAAGAAPLMDVTCLTKQGVFGDITFTLHEGEILGITGLLGSGRTSLAKALFGLVRPDSGGLTVEGRAVPLGDPLATAAARIGYVPEDRLTEGLFLTQSIIRNVAIGRLDAHGRGGVLDRGGLFAEAANWIERLKVKAPDTEAAVTSLSGGNQQRVALARWLSRAPRVLILNGPSVGVDVGSKADIHGIIRDLAQHGIGVIVISDDLPELLTTCHRILVMREGRITDELDRRETNEQDLSRRLAS
jgi:simple sugar transport system ATP-binding protein